MINFTYKYIIFIGQLKEDIRRTSAELEGEKVRLTQPSQRTQHRPHQSRSDYHLDMKPQPGKW